MDGLVWNNEPKILPIAFGMNKLQCGCVVEDAKVSVDDIYEKIESWDDIVQSIDTVNFQKLWSFNMDVFSFNEFWWKFAWNINFSYNHNFSIKNIENK